MSYDSLYITADAIGTPTGGGIVTYQESTALVGAKRLVMSFPLSTRPWGADNEALRQVLDQNLRPKLAHFYSGTFTRTIEELRIRGCKITYTAAAHSIDVSREEHEKFGLPFDYTHLTDPMQWAEYVRGYLLADVVICPSTYSKRIVEGYGCKNVVIIPHGVNVPEKVTPLPKRFSVAYLGQPGPDKGLIYLLQAWKMLNYSDAMLTIAGYGTEHLLPLVRQAGGGNIFLRGRVESVDEVYDACSLYVQPSASEGFGIEVLEAMARGREVICSDGAGAADCVEPHLVVPSRDARALAHMIHSVRLGEKRAGTKRLRETAESHAWPRIRDMYRKIWSEL